MLELHPECMRQLKLRMSIDLMHFCGKNTSFGSQHLSDLPANMPGEIHRKQPFLTL
jgi:hypothetical protein